MPQRVNPLVPRKLQNLEPTDLPVGALNKESLAAFDAPSIVTGLNGGEVK
jgi:hypothetical protein